ncbi:MAG: class I SAM-dependent methyltransferase [Lewinellaceae bacterium]|nr:class I SAM-dependent methyltransferase [Lewinellaceae bacterium]
MNDYSKSAFDPILDDYAFFEAHSTEAESDLKAYAAYLPQLGSSGESVHLLDFGCGTGSFTRLFLQQASWPPEVLELTLVEPGDKARSKAAETLQPFSGRTIRHYATLPDTLEQYCDLALANHVLYYVPDLGQAIRALRDQLRPGRKILAAMAGSENALIECWELGFGLLNLDVPYFTGNDMPGVLDQLGLNWHRVVVDFLINFPDTPENRLKILRFLFGTRLADFPQAPLLAFFDPYRRNSEIWIETSHFVYTIG